MVVHVSLVEHLKKMCMYVDNVNDGAHRCLCEIKLDIFMDIHIPVAYLMVQPYC